MTLADIHMRSVSLRDGSNHQQQCLKRSPQGEWHHNVCTDTTPQPKSGPRVDCTYTVGRELSISARNRPRFRDSGRVSKSPPQLRVPPVPPFPLVPASLHSCSAFSCASVAQRERGFEWWQKQAHQETCCERQTTTSFKQKQSPDKTNERANAMNAGTKERTKSTQNEQTNKRTNEQTNKRTNERTAKSTSESGRGMYVYIHKLYTYQLYTFIHVNHSCTLSMYIICTFWISGGRSRCFGSEFTVAVSE